MTIQLFDFIILALAIHRLSFMLVHEDGSFSITYVIRYLGIRKDNVPANKDLTFKQLYKRSLTENSSDVRHKVVNHFGKLLSCILCTSIWIACLTVIVYLGLKDTYFVYAFYILALADITLLIERLT